MIRTMIDSDVVSVLPHTVPLVATYSDLVPNVHALQDEHTGQQLVLIDRGQGDPSGQASIADVETGALTVEDIPGWLARKRAAGVQYLTVYCDRATLPRVDALSDLGPVFRWVATLDGTAHIDGYEALTAPAAVQTTGSGQLGFHGDLSLVFDAAWHPEPEPEWERQARMETARAMGNSQQLATDLAQLAILVSRRH